MCVLENKQKIYCTSEGVRLLNLETNQYESIILGQVMFAHSDAHGNTYVTKIRGDKKYVLTDYDRGQNFLPEKLVTYKGGDTGLDKYFNRGEDYQMQSYGQFGQYGIFSALGRVVDVLKVDGYTFTTYFAPKRG